MYYLYSYRNITHNLTNTYSCPILGEGYNMGTCVVAISYVYDRVA